jgi:hypothetical protein
LHFGIVKTFIRDSVLFEEMNVFTSLLGLVIVSHLSPKESGRFKRLISLCILVDEKPVRLTILGVLGCKGGQGLTSLSAQGYERAKGVYTIRCSVA